jgi:hypothetical protein
MRIWSSPSQQSSFCKHYTKHSTIKIQIYLMAARYISYSVNLKSNFIFVYNKKWIIIRKWWSSSKSHPQNIYSKKLKKIIVEIWNHVHTSLQLTFSVGSKCFWIKILTNKLVGEWISIFHTIENETYLWKAEN